MKIETKLNCGDKVFYFMNGRAEQITVGQVRVQFTKTKALIRGERFLGTVLSSDQFLPKADKYEETYMCIETGVGSGSIHTLGQTIFPTADECLAAHKEWFEEQERAKEARKAREKIELEQEAERIRNRMAQIEERTASA